MSDLRVKLCGVEMAGPVVAASGTFGFGGEYADICDLSCLGGISGKGLTLHGQPGNQGGEQGDSAVIEQCNVFNAKVFGQLLL